MLVKFYNKIAGRITFLQSVSTINIDFLYVNLSLIIYNIQ